MEHLHVALTVGTGGIGQGAGLPDHDAGIVHGQAGRPLEGEGAAAGAGTDHHGHPGTQVRCQVATEVLGGERRPDHEHRLGALHGGPDVGAGVGDRGEALQPTSARDAALCPDRRDVVSVCGLGVDGHPVAVLSPVEADRHAPVA